jgi:hypothetical protein
VANNGQEEIYDSAASSDAGVSDHVEGLIVSMLYPCRWMRYNGQYRAVRTITYVRLPCSRQGQASSTSDEQDRH